MSARFDRILMACGLKKHPKGRPAFIWAERANGWLAGLFLALGVPLLAISGFSSETKWMISTWWFVMSTVFIHLEARELLGQMYGRGFLDDRQVSKQKFTLVLPPFFGIVTAVIIWLVPEKLGLHVIGITEVHYGFVEWNLLGVSFVVFVMFYFMVDRLATNLSMSTQRRASFEQTVPPPTH